MVTARLVNVQSGHRYYDTKYRAECLSAIVKKLKPFGKSIKFKIDILLIYYIIFDRYANAQVFF